MLRLDRGFRQPVVMEGEVEDLQWKFLFFR